MTNAEARMMKWLRRRKSRISVGPLARRQSAVRFLNFVVARA